MKILVLNCGSSSLKYKLFDMVSLSQILEILNRQSGVFGVSGISPDFRDLEEEARRGSRQASLALMVYAYSVARGIGSHHSH